eukprot:c9837_g1_i1.p1 GENE.c9837_g1_i1~~c9837_g1_i1.p1  ORF type:complete len:311 (-),score=55.02 c9837_g1_i1:999-1898(-)
MEGRDQEEFFGPKSAQLPNPFEIPYLMPVAQNSFAANRYAPSTTVHPFQPQQQNDDDFDPMAEYETQVEPGPQSEPLLSNSVSQSHSSPSFFTNSPAWSLLYYRPYFDVNTSQVIERLIAPLKVRNKWSDAVGEKPDLYGPLWVATTLVFCMGVAGNVASALAFVASTTRTEWTYDFTRVTLAATLVYGYVFVVPLMLWLAMRWYGAKLHLTALWCCFGYGSFVFIPCSIICVPKREILRWLAITLAAMVSANCCVRYSCHLIRTRIDPAYRISKATPLCAFVCIFHLAFALMLKVFFF